MSNAVDLRNADDVMNVFEARKTPYIALYSGKDLKYFFDRDDLDESKQMLIDTLEAIQNNGSTAVYKIVFFKDLNKAGELIVNNKANELGSNTFRLNGLGMSVQRYNAEMNGSGYRSKLEQRVDAQDEKLDLILQKLNGPDPDDNDPDDQEQPTVKDKAMEMLAGVLDHPQVKDLLAGVAAKFLGNILGSGVTGSMQPNTAHALGTVAADQSAMDRLQVALQTLNAAGVTVDDMERLALLSEKDPNQFALLINMLRSMKV